MFRKALLALVLISVLSARVQAQTTAIRAGRLIDPESGAVARDQVTGHKDLGTGPLGALGNVIWLVLAGWWLALGHIVLAIMLAITIIGLPFAWAHLKLVPISLWPIGKMIVSSEEAQRLGAQPNP